MNKVLKILDEYVEENGLDTENFKEQAPEIPKTLKPTSILTVKKDETPLMIFACDRTSFWIDLLSNTTQSVIFKKQLEKKMREEGITQAK